ncbi:hypothetical protein [Rufibacter quisquiliarum]|uniref:STAS/SEC14 domain-containing protein n=1 Tax=Rufibacter quisquiliarum TaxID=1549639 RepID=A0A839GRM2_9BACT|nr:hypothetical protein [Rufibacter quisquiliarum]MBA9077527.1 hypothetical protein [Rufibacter quisquiliarum]
MQSPDRETIQTGNDFKIEYEPLTDILFVHCPPSQTLTLENINEGFRLVVKTIITRNISYLLVNPSQATTQVTIEQHQAVSNVFLLNLFPTKLKKLARIVSTDEAREERVHAIVRDSHLAFEFRNFKDEAAAVQWLKGTRAS